MVYFIQNQCPNKYIKIGRSDGFAGRLLELRIGSPYELVVLATTSKYTESEMHKRFEKFRVRSEWFRPEPELLAFIETLNFQESERKKYLEQNVRNSLIKKEITSNPWSPLSKISEEFGISEERVRQIIGKEACARRVALRQVNKRRILLKELKEEEQVEVSPFVKEAIRHGFLISKPRGKDGNNGGLLINGRRVKVAKASLLDGGYVLITPRADTDFIGCILPDGRAIIIPAKLMKNGASFHPSPKNNFYQKVNWRGFIEAWGLLSDDPLLQRVSGF